MACFGSLSIYYTIVRSLMIPKVHFPLKSLPDYVMNLLSTCKWVISIYSIICGQLRAVLGNKLFLLLLFLCCKSVNERNQVFSLRLDKDTHLNFWNSKTSFGRLEAEYKKSMGRNIIIEEVQLYGKIKD